MFAFSKLAAPERLIAKCLLGLAALVVATLLLSQASSAGANPSVAFEQGSSWLWAGIAPLLELPFAGVTVLMRGLADHYTFFAGAGGVLWSAHLLCRNRQAGLPPLHKGVDGAGLAFAMLLAVTHIFEAPRIFANIATFPDAVFFLVSLAPMLFPLSMGLVAFGEGAKEKVTDPFNESVFWVWLTGGCLSVWFPLLSLYGYTKAQPDGGLTVLLLLGHLTFAWATPFVAFLYFSMRKAETMPQQSETEDDCVLPAA